MNRVLKALYGNYLCLCFIFMWMRVVLPIIVLASIVSTKGKSRHEMLVQDWPLTTLFSNNRNRTDSVKEEAVGKPTLGKIF